MCIEIKSKNEWVVYLDPAVYLYQPLTDLQSRYAEATLLLTPHLLNPLADNADPDEKYVQNVGLYSSGFLALRHARRSHPVSWTGGAAGFRSGHSHGLAKACILIRSG
jgi:hypothetical protein